MENALRFLAAVLIMAVAALAAQFAQMKNIEMGSVADWAGAIANFMAVAVALSFSLLAHLKAQREDQARTKRTRDALKSAIANILEISENIAALYTGSQFPIDLERLQYRFVLNGIMRVWERVDMSRLDDFEAGIAAEADGPFNELFQILQRVIAQPERGEALTRALTERFDTHGTLGVYKHLLAEGPTRARATR